MISAAFIGTTTAAVLAGIYVLWGPSEKRKNRTKRKLCPGLINVGNSCFLNAVLQSLAPNPSVVHWLTRFVDKHRNNNRYTDYLAYTIGRVLQVLNNDSTEDEDEYSPDGVLKALRARRWVISSDQQDAHELFHVVTETLEEETAKFPAVLTLQDVASLDEGALMQYQSDNEACTRTKGNLPRLPDRDTMHPLRGLLSTQLQCTRCSHKYPIKYDTFHSISLSIPNHYAGKLTLERLLKQYVMSETLQNVECDNCQQLAKKIVADESGDSGVTKPRSTFVKRLTIGKLPECLCFHVQRTSWQNNGLPVKRFDHITFPEILSMDPYTYQKKVKPSPSPSFDVDLGAGLVGGRKGINGFHKVNAGKLQYVTSPTVSSPYSGPVNLLKALNYHSRARMGGFLVQPPQPTLTRVTDRANAHVQLLAQKYHSETRSIESSTNSYKLTSVIVHHGDVYSGHFITYRRAPSDNGQRFPEKWIYTSDTLVKRASSSEVFGAGAYMLFYEKI